MGPNKQELANTISATSPKFCEALTRDEIEIFVAFTRYREIEAEAILCEVGTISDEFFLITSGEIVLFRDEMGKEIELLEHHADFRPDGIEAFTAIAQGDLIHDDGALFVFLQSVDAPDEG